MNEYTIFSLGDSAVTIDLGNQISEALNQKVIAMKEWLQHHPFEGLSDIIIAYSSLTVIYQPAIIQFAVKPQHTVFDFVRRQLESAYTASVISKTAERLIHIPVCYAPAMAPDLEGIARDMQLHPDEVISLHTGRVYRVYLIGFLPGFPYLATVDERIAAPRKEQPRKAVPAGSVGIAGLQTGIYPLESPGGWQIIGRTPVRLFDKANVQLMRISPGDMVQFYPVNLATYEKLLHFKSPIAYY